VNHIIVIALASLALATPITAQFPAPPLAGREIRPAVYTHTESALESFLTKRKDAVVIQKPLGILTGRNHTQAIFTAIVASDPVDTAVKFKGLKIELQGENGKATEYLDYDRDRESGRDSLQEFQHQLAHIADKEKMLEQWRSQMPASSIRGTVIGAPNLNVGWYQRQEEIGVEIAVTDSALGWFYFPNADLHDLLEMVRAGCTFLNAK